MRVVSKGPLTIEQKQALIAAYHQHHRDVARAAADTGVTIRTAYLWIGRFEIFGEGGLQARSHARKGPYPPAKATDTVTARVTGLRSAERTLTVRQIAERLKAEGTVEISKSSVAAILKKAGMNSTSAKVPPVRPSMPTFVCQGALDLDQLGDDIRRGIEMDVLDRPGDAVQSLAGDVWEPLRARGDDEIERLLRDVSVGRLLLRSGLQLGHSLMNAGHWLQAAYYLRRVKDWIVTHEALRDRYDQQDLAVSLRRDDIAVECWEYLAIVLRETSKVEASACLDTAIAHMHRPYHGIAPTYPHRVLGTLYRARAKLRLRLSRGRDRSIEEDLRSGEGFLEMTDDLGWHAGRYLTWAQLHHYRSLHLAPTDRSGAIRERAAMERAITQMLDITVTFASPILRTKFFIDAARLYSAHGMANDIDRERMREAAAHCVRYGYAGQARHLLDVRGIKRWLPEELVSGLQMIAQRTS